MLILTSPPTPAGQQETLLALKLGGASRDEIERRVKKQRGGGDRTVKSSRIVCSLASGVSVTVSGPALSLDQALDALAEAQKEGKKARAEGLNAKAWQAVMRDRARQGD